MKNTQINRAGLTQLVWSVSLGAIYHTERATFAIRMTRIFSLLAATCIVALAAQAPFELVYHVDLPPTYPLGFSLTLVMIVVTGALFSPYRKTRMHIRLSQEYSSLHARIVELSTDIPEAYFQIFQHDLISLLRKEPKRLPLLALYCNNALINEIPEAVGSAIPIPYWKIALRHVFPFKESQQPYAVMA